MICALPSRAAAPQLASSKAPVRAMFTSQRPIAAQRCSTSVACSSQNTPDQERPSLAQRLALPAAAVLGAALLFAATPEDAMAARSGGRMGGGGGFSRRSAPMPSRAPSGGGSVRNYNTYVAPPIISPYGLGGGMGYGYGFGGGVGIMPFPMGFGMGGLFNIIFVMFVLNVILNTVRQFTNKEEEDKDEKWEDDKDDKW